MTTLGQLANVFGERETGADVRKDNMTAILTVANILKSSLGPQGLDKMLVDDIGEVTITNDGATILQLLEVQHPAARVLVDLSNLQDEEVGDGTTSVVLIAAELLRRAQVLVQSGIHPTSVIAGYKLAMKESVRFIQKELSVSREKLGTQLLLNIAKTALSSKYIGADGEFFAHMLVEAVQGVRVVNSQGDVKYPVKAVNVLKTHGRYAKESFLADGYALRTFRAAQGMPTSVKDAKIAIIDINLRQHRMQMGVQIEVQDPEELIKIREKERDMAKEKVKKILGAGANVVVTAQGFDDMVMKYFVEAGVMALRRVSKPDMRRIAKATGGKIVMTLSNMNGEESFDPNDLGHCDEVVEEKVGDWEHIFFRGCEQSKAKTIVLRGANDFMLDEVERSIRDALCALSRTLENNAVVAGGGAVEGALAIYLEDFARTLGSREQLAIAEFAEALLVIPKTLAVNASKDSIELLARLRMHHHQSQHCGQDPAKAKMKWYGLDLTEGKIRDNLEAGVVEPSIGKIKAIRFATEAAVTILRIDDVIRLHPETEDKEGGQ